METPERASSSSSSQDRNSTSSPLPHSSSTRQWRPAAQRNLRNQWSKLASCRSQWASASSNGRSHATSLVNAYLSQKSMGSMELGALKDMPDIRKNASEKLLKQQVVYRRKLLSSYKEMVDMVIQMVNSCKSMRCFVKGASTQILQFSSSSDDSNDPGDGGGIPVFMFLPISSHEQLAEELSRMFICELNLKRLLVLQFLAIDSEGEPNSELCWSDELYPGEFDDLSLCHSYSKETREPVPPRSIGGNTDKPLKQFNRNASRDTLQVYLTTWLAEVNVDPHRVDEIFATIGEELHVSF